MEIILTFRGPRSKKVKNHCPKTKNYFLSFAIQLNLTATALKVNI